MKTCAFTGHRPKGLGYPELDERCAALKEKLRSLIVKLMEEAGVTHFISGNPHMPAYGAEFGAGRVGYFILSDDGIGNLLLQPAVRTKRGEQIIDFRSCMFFIGSIRLHRAG